MILFTKHSNETVDIPRRNGENVINLRLTTIKQNILLIQQLPRSNNSNNKQKERPRRVLHNLVKKTGAARKHCKGCYEKAVQGGKDPRKRRKVKSAHFVQNIQMNHSCLDCQNRILRNVLNLQLFSIIFYNIMYYRIDFELPN